MKINSKIIYLDDYYRVYDYLIYCEGKALDNNLKDEIDKVIDRISKLDTPDLRYLHHNDAYSNFMYR